MKTLLRFLDGVMKRSEPPGEEVNHDREMAVYNNNNNEELYSALFFATTGPKYREAVRQRRRGRARRRHDGMASPRRKVQQHQQGTASELEREVDNQNAHEGRRSARLLVRDAPLEDFLEQTAGRV